MERKKMGYYQRIAAAQDKIKILISTGVCTLKDIQRHIYEEMQMSSRFVNKYVEDRVDGDYAKFNDAGLIYEVKKKKKDVKVE